MSVYFITCRDQGICKIGYAQNPKARRSSLQTAFPSKLVLEATIPGSAEVERGLHQRFAEHRLSGEWFTITDELDAFIKDAASSVVVSLPIVAPLEKRLSDEELAARSLAKHRLLLAEAMMDFERAGCVASGAQPPDSPRFYRPVPASGGQFSQHYAIRAEGEHRLLCLDLKLTWDQADRLCDVFESVRQRALEARPTDNRMTLSIARKM